MDGVSSASSTAPASDDNALVSHQLWSAGDVGRKIVETEQNQLLKLTGATPVTKGESADATGAKANAPASLLDEPVAEGRPQAELIAVEMKQAFDAKRLLTPRSFACGLGSMQST